MFFSSQPQSKEMSEYEIKHTHPNSTTAFQLNIQATRQYTRAGKFFVTHFPPS